MERGTVRVLSSSKADNSRPNSELYIVAEENEAFKSTRRHGCGLTRSEDTLGVSSQRVLFLWRKWACGMCLTSMEEAFALDDLQFMTLGSSVRWLGLVIGLVGFIVGAALCGVADSMKKATLTDEVLRWGLTPRMPSEYPILVAVGIVLLLGGLVMVALSLVKIIKRGQGVVLTLNFSRPQAGILDWSAGSWWRPKMSSTRRTIKLEKEAAQEAYNVMWGLLQQRFSIKAHR